MKKSFVILFISFLLSISITQAQKDEVNKYLRLVAYGKIDEVRAVIPDLLAKYPNDPGIKLLHGIILDDAFLAIDIYQAIIKNNPESQWADHAYWRIIQFYAVLGDTSKAQSELTKFRQLYPASSFIGPASDVVRSSVNLAKRSMKSTTTHTEIKLVNQESPKATKAEANSKPKEPLTSLNNENTINPDKLVESVDLSHNKSIDKSDKKLTDDKSNSKLIPLPNEKIASKPEKPKAEKNNSEPAIIRSTEQVRKDSVKTPEFYGLQVGIYKENNAAESEKNKFLIRRLRTQVVEKVVNGVVMYAVVIGHYSSLESAEEGKKIVSIQCSCEPIIYVK